jgi:hypothetical protein
MKYFCEFQNYERKGLYKFYDFVENSLDTVNLSSSMHKHI